MTQEVRQMANRATHLLVHRCRSLMTVPLMHRVSRERPHERMSVAAIVLVERPLDMRDQLGATFADTISQVPAAEGAQHQFGLVDPGGMSGCEMEHDAPLLRGQPCAGRLRHMS